MNKLIGLPYASNGRGPEFDCWGFCMFAAKELYDVVLPDYRYPTSDDCSISAFTIFSALKSGVWEKVTGYEPGDVHIFRVGRFHCHCGLHVGDDSFLHCLRGRNSTLERLGSTDWSDRLQDTWRYRA